ncbi:MAG: erythromycin esterase family protein [Bdellovibrio sp.]
MKRFENRQDAGRSLAQSLLQYKKENPLVLAIPRGGIPVAFEVAKTLKASLDIILVKKIGAPKNPELAVGAVSEDSKPIFNEELVQLLNIDRKSLNKMAEQKINDLKEQAQKLRGKTAFHSVKNRVVILVDDGIATGATLSAAIQLIKQNEPKKIIVAAPVGANDSVQQLKTQVDEVVCLEIPQHFMAVGIWYETFDQVADEDVIRFLGEANYLKNQNSEDVLINHGSQQLPGELTTVEEMRGLVIFAHGSGSNYLSPRNKFVAQELNRAGFGTLLFDLLTEEEAADRQNVFNTDLLTERLLSATHWVEERLRNLPIAYFGASTGTAAAFIAASKTNQKIYAIVSRGGRPDLAEEYLSEVNAPTLLIVGENDTQTIPYNKKAQKKLKSAKLVIIPEASPLFEEPGALDEVVEYALDWFLIHLPNRFVSMAPKENIVRELESNAYPIKDSSSFDDLIEKIANSKIVMLGEASHGTQEFYSVRREISQRLIKDHGFNFIAVEGDWPDCQKINEYIQNERGANATEVMKQFQRWPTWMWANEETAKLVEWMKSKKIPLHGLDVYSLFEAMDYVTAFTSKIDPELAKSVTEQYACFSPFDRDEKAYAKYIMKFPEGCRKEVVTNLRTLLRLRLDAFALEDPDLFNAQQCARIVANAEQYYRTMFFGGPQSWNVRDNHMMDTLEHLLRRAGPNSKAIVWAHNTHIGDYHATDMAEEGYVNIGGLARERFGVESVSLVGFGTYQGTVLASPSWEGPETITSLPAAKESSLEHYCHKVAMEMPQKNFYLIFDTAIRNGVLGLRRYPHRAVGVVYRTQYEQRGQNYVPTIPAKRYDAFIFIDQTSALKSIPTKENKLDFPETWPGGY